MSWCLLEMQTDALSIDPTLKLQRVVKSSLLSHKYQKAHWVNFFFSKDPGVDMTLGCPRKVFDTKTDNTTTTTEPSPSKKGTTNPNP